MSMLKDVAKGIVLALEKGKSGKLFAFWALCNRKGIFRFSGSI